MRRISSLSLVSPQLRFFSRFFLRPRSFPSSFETMSSFYSEIHAPSGAYKAFINGEWRESTSGKTVAINNPTTEGVAFQVQGKFEKEKEKSLQKNDVRRHRHRIRSSFGGVCAFLDPRSFQKRLHKGHEVPKA